MSAYITMRRLSRAWIAAALFLTGAESATAASATLLGVREDTSRGTANGAVLAEILSAAGARSARAPCLGPADAGAPEFATLDRFVATFQAAGFSELVLCLEPAAAKTDASLIGSRLPLASAAVLDRFASWVASVVERYDADGQDDMPGLSRTVRIFEIGSGLAGRRPADVSSYLPLLEHAHRAAHAVNASVLITHAALLATGLGEGSAAHARIGALSREERGELFARPELFDLVNLQTVSGSTQLDRALLALGAEMAERGLRKPILVSDASPPPLVAWGAADDCDGVEGDQGIVLPPADPAQRCDLARLFSMLLDAEPASVAWAHRFAAGDLIRKAIVAADRGVWVIVLSPLRDGDWWRRPALRAAAGLTPWTGLFDAEAAGQRPALRALEQAAALLQEIDGLDRVRDGPADQRLYAMSTAAGTQWVAWLDTPGVVLPGDSVVSRIIHFRSDSPRVSVEPLLGGRAETLRTLDGVAWVEITQEPVRIRPLGN